MEMLNKAKMAESVEAAFGVAADMASGLMVRTHWSVECRDAAGDLKWAEDRENLVTTEGLNDVLNKYFKGSTYTAAWYVGLKGAGTIAIGDTAASHAGWSENTTYSEGARQTLTLGTVASATVNNSASKAVFTINGAATIAGAFLISNSTKGGTSGVLFSASDFSSSRTLASGDTVTVTVTLTAA